MDANSLAGRLDGRAQQLGLKPANLAEDAGLPRSFIYDILRGRSKRPDRQKLDLIAQALKVDTDWLLFGKGNVQGAHPVFVDPDDAFVSVKLAAPRPSMGGGSFIESDDADTDRTYQFRKAWIRNQLGSSPQSLRLLHVEGDSMEPTLKDGDMVLVDMGRKRPSPPGVFVLHDGIGLVAKRIEPIPNSDPPKLRIISDNPVYAPYERLLEEINIVGRIRWYGREM